MRLKILGKKLLIAAVLFLQLPEDASLDCNLAVTPLNFSSFLI